MKAMILAAGRGDRMRPLTDTTPKPLLQVGALCLIEHHINKLVNMGIEDIVINTGWLAEQIHKQLGNGDKYGAKIIYSDEGYPALETAGGIINALSHFENDPFIVVNADIFCEFDFSTIKINPDCLAHLILVPNPSQHSKGDFSLVNGKVCISNNDTTYTFSGIAVYHPEFFTGVGISHLALRPVFDKAIAAGSVGGQVYTGSWHDIGTPDRLDELRRSLR